jgi:hypothetical protein
MARAARDSGYARAGLAHQAMGVIIANIVNFWNAFGKPVSAKKH